MDAKPTHQQDVSSLPDDKHCGHVPGCCGRDAKFRTTGSGLGENSGRQLLSPNRTRWVRSRRWLRNKHTLSGFVRCWQMLAGIDVGSRIFVRLHSVALSVICIFCISMRSPQARRMVDSSLNRAAEPCTIKVFVGPTPSK